MHLGIIASMKNGLEHFVYREMCELAARGCKISLFPTKQRPGLYGPQAGWAVHRWSVLQVLWSQPWRFLRGPVQYIALLIEALRYRAVVDFFLAAHFAPAMRDVDVIYATFGDHKLFIGYFCKRLVNRPLAVTIHAYELYQNPNPRLFPVALAACDQIAAVSEHNRDVLRDRFGIQAERVDVVRLAIDLAEYRPAKKFVVLIVAFFVEKKGHETLFQAVQRMERDDVEIWVVGGPNGSPYDVDVPALAREYGIESQVAFFGKLSGPALKAVYHASDVFCLPSRVDSRGEAEGFPTAIIEAMACGKPVVTTRHVEIPRIVEQILVNENDAGALAEALEHVYESQTRRELLGARNRELAEQHFSLRNLEERMRLFEQIADPARTRPPTAAPGKSDRSHAVGRANSKRVLMLIENAPYAWDGRVRREANTLAAAGYDVTVICQQAPGEGWCEQFGPVTAYQFPPPPAMSGSLGYLLEYAYVLTMAMLLSCYVAVRRGFDVVHAHNPPDLFVLVGGFWKLFGKRFVFDQHDVAPEMYLARFAGRANGLVHRALVLFERLSCTLADQVIVANESCARLVAERTGVSPSKIAVVRNGPEPCHLQLAEPMPGLRQGAHVLIGYVGVMGKQDGVDGLLRALSHLTRDLRRADWRCVFVGDGEMVPRLEQLAAELGFAERLQFTGWLDYRTVPAHIAAMDICVAPDPANEYTLRSTVIKLMEYMAQAKPIVAFDLPEHRVTAADSALYAAANDERDFARQIARLMDNCALREQLGQAGRVRALSTLAWSQQERCLLGAYEQIGAPRFDMHEATRRGAFDEPSAGGSPRGCPAQEHTWSVASSSQGPG
jgi:glycosyltransferase involved in cell wall biosynthesis